jgi:hypothetical protein
MHVKDFVLFVLLRSSVVFFYDRYRESSIP